MLLKRFCSRASLALAVLALILAARAQESPPAAETVEKQLIANFKSDQAALGQFTHDEHVVTNKDGVRDARRLHVWYVNGRAVSETFSLDDRVLSPGEIAAEHQRALERARQAARRPAPPQGLIEFEGQTYSFEKLAGDYLYGPADTRTWQGRTVWVYPATPNPRAPSRSRAENLLLHSQGEIWVDAEDLHVIRIALHTTAPVHYGLGVLATIHHARLDLQLQRQAPGLWLPAEADFSLDATLLMLRRIERSKFQTYSNYQEAPLVRNDGGGVARAGRPDRPGSADGHGRTRRPQ